MISENGEISQFDTIAENIMSDSVESIQLAPAGIVTDIYPAEGNETGKIDLIHDKDRGEISIYARGHHTIVTQGPFELKQGGYGIAVRNPIYLKDENGQEYFWGFTIVILRVPDIFSDATSALSKFGYEYSLSKTDDPWSDHYKVVYQSDHQLTDPVSYDFMIGEENWKFEVTPENGWGNNTLIAVIGVFFIAITLLLAVLTRVWLVSKEDKNKFQILAHTDSLTGIYNRYGFDKAAEKMLNKNPDTHFVVALLDIDDFKFINDMYGHVVGDAALKSLAQDMKDSFGVNAILCRNGGDEFSVILIGTTEEEAKSKIESFTLKPRHITYNGEEHPFYISLGYAEYPKDCDDVSELIRCADMALYAVKLHGKHSCSPYRSDYKIQNRSQLGFALQDVSKNLPGAFLIYIADPEDDRILFANRELIEFAGCKDFDDFLDYTGQRFKNLIHPDERDSVETSIWKQIDAKTSGNNDYVRFHFAKKDGSYRPVLDHGRIVENRYYGNVFYVLIMDCALVESFYDGFSR